MCPFRIWPRTPIVPTDFSWFSSDPPVKYFMFGDDRFLPHPFQFSDHSMLSSWQRWWISCKRKDKQSVHVRLNIEIATRPYAQISDTEFHHHLNNDVWKVHFWSYVKLSLLWNSVTRSRNYLTTLIESLPYTISTESVKWFGGVWKSTFMALCKVGSSVI
jgi:hypothetical protein